MNDPVPMQIAAAEKIAAACDRERKSVRPGVRMANEVGARLARFVRTESLQRGFFVNW
jgi:hypothetical protein